MTHERIIIIRISRKVPLNGSMFSSRTGKFIRQFMESGGNWPEPFRKTVLSEEMFCDLDKLKFYRLNQ